jgi:hypothetical protein
MANPNGEGIYRMKRADGKEVGVPYSKITGASGAGFFFPDDNERSRYVRDAQADPTADVRHRDPNSWAPRTLHGQQAAEAPQSSAQGTWHKATDWIGNNSLAREVAGDVGNAGAIASGAQHVGDTSAGDQVKDPNAGWGTKAVAGVMELMAGEPMLKALGPAAQLAKMAPALRVLEQWPSLQRAVMLGMRASAEVGAQDILQGKGTGEAARDAAVAGVAGPAVDSLTRGAGNLIQRTVNKISPKTVNIAGEEIPALANQVGEGGSFTGVAAENAPEIQKAQQQGGANVVRNTAQGAAKNVLDKLNATRATADAAPASAMRLPSPEGAQPFTFELPTTPTTEEPTGELLHSAGKTDRHAFEQPQYTADSRPTPRNGNEGSMGGDIETAGKPEARGEQVGGGGALSTTNPHEAEAWRYSLQERMEQPDFKQLPEAQQAAMQEAHDKLEQQLGLYYNSPYAARFEPINTDEALSRVQTFGQAANEIQNAVKPVYETLDRLSGGEFNKWKLQARRANQIIRNASSADAVEAAEGKLKEANDSIDDIITRHGGSISQGDYRAAKYAWQQSAALDSLHAVMERMANGITAEESERGLPRVITGNAKMLENWLSRGSNRASVENLIGVEGVDNLKKMSLLLSNASTARATNNVLKRTSEAIGRHIGRSGTGALAGSVLFASAGMPWWKGAVAGAAVEDTMRTVLRYATINPRIGNLVQYAAEHSIDPKVYAPLIARAIADIGGQQKSQETSEASPFAGTEEPQQQGGTQ